MDIESEFPACFNLFDVLKQVLHAPGDHTTLVMGQRLIGSHHGVSLSRACLSIGEYSPVEPIDDPVDYWYRHLIENALLLNPRLQEGVELERSFLASVLPDLYHATLTIKHVNATVLTLLIWIWWAKPKLMRSLLGSYLMCTTTFSFADFFYAV